MNNSVKQFFGCYFHQDWRLEYDGFRAAIDDFAKHSTPNELVDVLAFANEMLAADDVEAFAPVQYGGSYHLEGDKVTSAEFLQYLQDALLFVKH